MMITIWHADERFSVPVQRNTLKRRNHQFQKINSRFFAVLFFLVMVQNICFSQKQLFNSSRCFYFSASGNDHQDGSIDRPFRTIAKFNSLKLRPGDQVCFHGGDTFNGNIILDSTKSGSIKGPVAIRSFGTGKARINGGNNEAFLLYKTKFIQIRDLILVGAGRKNGNSKDGLRIDSSDHIKVSRLDVSGFQKSGIMIYASADVRCLRINAHENGSAGFSVEGPYAKKESNHNIYIGYCIAQDNPGDPTNLSNHSGNGIVVGNCTKVLIEFCTATNNGWDMPRIGNGPVGIWAYEADSVIIQHCLSYRNKTPAGAADGDGFDLDGGVTNSIIQYCLSYENYGSGFCIFQYLYATPWHDNIFRFNISENDGNVSDSQGGIQVWNSSRDSSQFYNCLFYNNTVYNPGNAALSYSELSQRKNFYFFNNIFVGKDSLIKGERGVDTFCGNDWWSLSKKFDIENVLDFKKWVTQSNQERKSGRRIGLNIDPEFIYRNYPKITSAVNLVQFINYRIPQKSILKKHGADLFKAFQINNGGYDFFLKQAAPNGIGACLN
jgi:Right handed beta helix region